ncbi:MAG: Holliday junction resolvase RuvX [Meiothermus sp.]|nr:Holliday junction resolvase RuvX [Meiothermus sp.]
MKLAALDVGEARIGLAVGDLGRAWAFGRGYLVRKTLGADLAALRAFAEAERTEKFVVGLPLRTDGRPSAQAERVLGLVEAMRREGMMVELVDERYTTKIGQNRLMSAPKRVRQEKGKLDEAAAVALLESYLSHPAASQAESEPSS